ncbi:hypothetical protein HMPREF9946_04846 [Acetobacteraceae bacterium AT-5844]|nr:hypothetical protein HMPREF9946_04846 [Acetobacteraceae bacterium AT-5844]
MAQAMVILRRAVAFRHNFIEDMALTKIPAHTAMFDRPAWRAPAMGMEDFLPGAPFATAELAVGSHLGANL